MPLETKHLGKTLRIHYCSIVTVLFQFQEHVNVGQWLVHCENPLVEFYANKIVPMINSTVWTYRSLSNGSINMDEIYSIDNVKLISNSVGHWSSTSGLAVTDSSVLDRRGDLQGITFKAVVIHVRQVAYNLLEYFCYHFQ